MVTPLSHSPSWILDSTLAVQQCGAVQLCRFCNRLRAVLGNTSAFDIRDSSMGRTGRAVAILVVALACTFAVRADEDEAVFTATADNFDKLIKVRRYLSRTQILQSCIDSCIHYTVCKQ